MEKVATAAAFSTSSFGFSSWEEVFVSSDRGSREVHYYLKRRDESSDLAVVGKEKSLRHMSYHYALRNRLPFSSSLVKLKSRREVIDWLDSIVSGAHADKLSRLDMASLDGKDTKDIQSQKFSQYTKDFLWLGLPWSCRKKRKHYPSFQRNGVKISVHDFVYVLAEEGKRLVAYLEDLYEDSRGNKMVVVRWFHKIDEVGIILPLNFNDREIFCSLCLQDLSIECIDGLATVLGPLHFEKFMSEARHTRLEPFVCRKQFDNDEVRPFDITRLKGYWKQDILRYMYTLSPSVDQGSSEQSDEEHIEEGDEDAVNGIRLRKRQCTERRDSVRAAHVVVRNSSGNDTCIVRGGSSAATLSNKLAKDNSRNFEVGCHVEVLSQDSGMRGCWFRASIMKRRRDKVKVRYQDVQDADDEANMLEEWILASRAASSDQLGLRIRGRTVVRPAPQSSKGRVSWLVDVGTVVDVWRHDGWWEGIVFQKESEDRFRVYFPAEKQDSVFSRRELRHSQEWLGNGWTQMKERPDLAAKILHNFVSKDSEKTSHHISAPVVIGESKLPSKDESGRKDSSPDTSDKNVKPKPGERSLDLSKDDLLSQLKWKSSKKRRRGSGNSVHKLQYTQTLSNGAPNSESSRACERFVIPANLKVDHDNCKFMGDSLFSSSVVPPLTSLVMSR